MSNILDYEAPIGYRVSDALSRLFTDVGKEAEQTQVFDGGITVPTDLVRSIGVAITDAVLDTIRVLTESGVVRRSLVSTDVDARLHQDAKGIISDPFDSFTFGGAIMASLQNIIRVADAVLKVLSQPARSWNAIYLGIIKKIVKIGRVIAKPKLLVAIGYAVWLEVKKIVAFVVFRNTGANILRSLSIMVITIITVWVRQIIALAKSLKRWAIRWPDRSLTVFNMRITIPGLNEPASASGLLARKARRIVHAIKRGFAKLWHEFTSLSIGRLIGSVFGAGNEVRRSAQYTGLFNNLKNENGFNLFNGSKRYPGAFTEGGSTRQDTYNRHGISSGRVVWP